MASKTLSSGDTYIVRGAPSAGLTARGRIMKVPREQVVEFLPPNRYFWPLFEHIGGPLKGMRIRFAEVSARRAKIRDTCTCDSYGYPHKLGAGRCQNRKHIQDAIEELGKSQNGRNESNE